MKPRRITVPPSRYPAPVTRRTPTIVVGRTRHPEPSPGRDGMPDALGRTELPVRAPVSQTAVPQADGAA